jgi:hypothetical protein
VSARLSREAFAVLALVSVGVLCALAAPNAHAATTRAEYVAQVDPLCQAGQAQELAAVQPFLRATKRAQKHHKLRSPTMEKRLARRFAQYISQYAAIEHQVNSQIAEVTPAPDDVSLIQVWLRARNELVDQENNLFGAFAHPKRIKNPFKIFTSFFEVAAREFEVADLVRDFGFQYCTSTAEVQIIGNGLPSACCHARRSGP